MNPYRTGNCECSTTRGVPPFKARFCSWKANAIATLVVLIAMSWMLCTLTRIFADAYRQLAVECHVDAGVDQ